MNEMIIWEGSAFLTALYVGMILALEYDFIRIFRRVFIHKKVWTMSVEDIIFWINAGITLFCVTYRINSGVMRAFMIAGNVLGAWLYRKAFSHIIVKYISKMIKFLLKPLKKVYTFIRMSINKLKREKK